LAIPDIITKLRSNIMKHSVVGCILFTVLLGGCESPTVSEDPGALDAWMVGATNDAAIRNAIIRQSTLFPYQFEQNGTDLNNLGARDVTVLATHFRSYPGQLNIRRGTESEELYKKRVKKVVDYLGYAGVSTEKISVKNLPAGGEGMPSALMILILDADAAKYSKPETGSNPTDKPTIMGGGTK
jgi:hypothetical protein